MKQRFVEDLAGTAGAQYHLSLACVHILRVES